MFLVDGYHQQEDDYTFGDGQRERQPRSRTKKKKKQSGDLNGERLMMNKSLR